MLNRSPESAPTSNAGNAEPGFNILTDSTETNEASRELSEERGDKVNKTEIIHRKREKLIRRRIELQVQYDEITRRRDELLKKREELLKRKAELEAKLRAAGVTIPGEAAPEPSAAESEASEPTPEPEQQPEAEPQPEPQPDSEPQPQPDSEPEPEPQSEPDSEPQPEADTSAEDSPAQVGQKLKKHNSFKRFLAGVALAALATIMTATGFKPNPNAKATEPGKATARTESVANPSVSSGESDTAETSEGNLTIERNLNSDLAGEAFNGTTYNYTEYADHENKITYHAYGYNYKDQFGDRAASTKGILHMAEYEPEALASYAAGIFTDEEKQALGIKGLNMTQIDDVLSNSEHGGDLQKKLLEKLKQVLEDESTNFDFYYENDTEQTNYIYFIDDNGDGVLTPSELHLGYDTKKRNHAPQVDISRRITMPDGTTKVVKMLDLNLSCGYQPNFEVVPEGVPEVPTNPDPGTPPVPEVPTNPDPGTPPVPDEPDKPKPDEPDEPKPDEPKPDEPDEPKPDEPKPDEPKKPKDPENLKRIDDKILEDIAEDIGTEKVVVTPTENVEDVEEKTEKPSGADYEGTGPTIVENEASIPAEEIQPALSPENDYSQNQGGANAGNAEANPVRDNTAGQAAADQNEIPISEAPTSGEALENALGDLGIS